MTPEIRRAALHIAAKTALVVSVGCGAPQTPPRPPTPQTCSAYLDQLPTTASPDLKLAPDDPIRDRMSDGLGIYAMFADATQRRAPRTQTCCSEELTSGPGTHRGPCCSALDDGAHHEPGAYYGGITDTERAACAPWGPPCPPELG